MCSEHYDIKIARAGAPSQSTILSGRHTNWYIPGLTLLEPAATHDRGMCCGAGGAQMFKEEESGNERVSAARTQQLLDTDPDAVGSACPFCMRMLTDGLADKDREEIPSLDIAEVLLESVLAAKSAEAANT